MKLGERLRALRLEAKLTQDELAARCGLSVSYISMIERDERVPHLDSLERVAAALGLRAELRFVPANAPDGMSAELETLRKRVLAAVGGGR